MELFLQKRLSWFRKQAESLRLLFFIFGTLALFSLSMGLPLLGFIYSGLSLLLFFAIPSFTAAAKPQKTSFQLPAPIIKYNKLGDLQPAIDWLVEGHHFSHLKEYLVLLKKGGNRESEALQEMQNLSKYTIDQLEAELFLMQAYSRMTSLDALELGSLTTKSKSGNALRLFGRQLKNNGHWRYASEVLAYWADKHQLHLDIDTNEIEAALHCQIKFKNKRGQLQYVHSPIMTAFMERLAMQYQGRFFWEKEGQSLSLIIPNQKVPSSTI